ncbi:cobalamin-dependent protein [Desulfoluna sp.]|uniref:cobalamin B12-binding domain-containing protein n=1 Tax=Desulfoluna sp. TaxID=2045199 RepID=UPI002623E79E|nr:cobalamin-dependent protein [Desulfoluna sp.]
MIQPSPVDENRQTLKALIVHAERDEANAFLDALTAQSSYREVFLSLLEPVLKEIGEMWVEEELSLAQGYVAGKIAEDLLEKMVHSGESPKGRPNSKGPVVIGNIEDDYHELGKKMVGTFLRTAGWKVYDLGSDVTAEEFVAKAVEVGARIIGVSAMMYSTADHIKRVREEIEARGLQGKVLLAVGGAVFKLQPELVHEVGGDGTIDAAMNAPEFFERLWAKARVG